MHAFTLQYGQVASIHMRVFVTQTQTVGGEKKNLTQRVSYIQYKTNKFKINW